MTKARIKRTGDIVYLTPDAILYLDISQDDMEEIEIIDDTSDYWTRLEHQYAGAAMQELIANPIFMKDHEGDFQVNEDMVAVYAYDIAHALVQKLKGSK